MTKNLGRALPSTPSFGQSPKEQQLFFVKPSLKLTRLIFSVLWLTDSYQSRSLPLTTSPPRVAQGDQPNQPPAANMRELVWDEELAASAQRWDEEKKQWFFRRMQRCLSLRWADQCTYSHDYAKQTLDGVYVGQNLYQVNKIPQYKILSANILSDVGKRHQSKGAGWCFSRDCPGTKSWKYKETDNPKK